MQAAHRNCAECNARKEQQGELRRVIKSRIQNKGNRPQWSYAKVSLVGVGIERSRQNTEGGKKS